MRVLCVLGFHSYKRVPIVKHRMEYHAEVSRHICRRCRKRLWLRELCCW